MLQGNESNCPLANLSFPRLEMIPDPSDALDTRKRIHRKQNTPTQPLDPLKPFLGIAQYDDLNHLFPEMPVPRRRETEFVRHSDIYFCCVC